MQENEAKITQQDMTRCFFSRNKGLKNKSSPQFCSLANISRHESLQLLSEETVKNRAIFVSTFTDEKENLSPLNAFRFSLAWI